MVIFAVLENANGYVYQKNIKILRAAVDEINKTDNVNKNNQNQQNTMETLLLPNSLTGRLKGK